MKSIVRKPLILIIVLLVLGSPRVFAQNKLLTIDDIFDPAKRVNFSGTPSNPRWLKDGEHYIVVSKDRNAFPRRLKVNAITGKSEPVYDATKMQAAIASLPGVGKEDARRLANHTRDDFSPGNSR